MVSNLLLLSKKLESIHVSRLNTQIHGHFAVFSSWLQLEKLFQTFGVSKQKGFFPYDYFTHADQLNETTLLPHETFYSTIKNCNVLEEEHTAFQKLLDQGKSEQEALQVLRLPVKPNTGLENYQWLQQLWTENQWSTFADFLKWYNDLDVTPMIKTIENLNQFYKNIRIDFIRKAISIPGVAMRVCFNSITDPAAEFHLFNSKNKDQLWSKKKVRYLHTTASSTLLEAGKLINMSSEYPILLVTLRIT